MTLKPERVTGIKKRGSNRHWAGSGKIRIEENVIPQYLAISKESKLSKSQFEVIGPLPKTNRKKFKEILNKENE